MIENMNFVYIVARATHRDELLETLKNLGILHLAQKKSADEQILKRFATISELSTELKDYVPKKAEDVPILSDEEFEEMYTATVAALSEKSALQDKRARCVLDAEKIRAWGDFDPDSVKELKSYGFDLHFYRIGKKEYEKLKNDEDVRFISLAKVDKMNTVAVFGNLGPAFASGEFELPDKSLLELQNEAAECESSINECDKILSNSAKYLKSYSDQLLKAQNAVEYSAVDKTLEGDGDLIWLSGYIPESEFAKFTDAAKDHGWAWYTEEATKDDENVPTKIRYNKLTALAKPVFDILGTVPGYREYDISFWFLAFFTLFFAMIIGDAGYGLIFLIAAVVLNLKSRKLDNVTMLLYVLSVATVAWGAVTGTWFGVEKAMEIPFFKALVIPSFANYPEYFGVESVTSQNAVMKFCFSIGVIQLALACIMNIRRKISLKDLSLVSDVGWLLSISALYFTVLYLVIGQSINVTAVAIAVGIGFVLVVLFGGMSPDKSFIKGMLSGVSDIFTIFLNTISAFGNIMSYIRLFAVGMASLAIAQSFNNMASGAGAVLGVVIVVVGHLLNIIMGFLSVVVHGVRLNLMEFSGQLGMEWSGTAYDPFCDSKKIKK